jgi:putative ABC transport system ATP-binding protein
MLPSSSTLDTGRTANTMKTDKITLENVNFFYGKTQAIRDVSISFPERQVSALIGPSGCGKSTLLHLLAALDQPTSGTVEVLGHDLAKVRDRAGYRREVVGLVFQLHNLLPQLSAAQNVELAMFGTRRTRRERARRARELLADVDLAGREDRTPTRLSGGERQRVAIARALANDPPLLLADEPTGSLDTASVARVIELVRRLRRERADLTVLMVTHDDQVARAADRIVHMRDGQVDDGRPAAALDPAGEVGRR